MKPVLVHALEVERPGRGSGDVVTVACACRLWSRTVLRERVVDGRVVPDLDEAERVARASYTEHEHEIPALDAQHRAIEERARQAVKDTRTARRLAGHDEEASALG